MKASEIRAAAFEGIPAEHREAHPDWYDWREDDFEAGARWALADQQKWAEGLPPLVKRETIIKRCEVEEDK